MAVVKVSDSSRSICCDRPNCAAIGPLGDREGWKIGSGFFEGSGGDLGFGGNMGEERGKFVAIEL